MKAEIWLPLATLLGGWGLAQITEVLKDRRATNRDRLARQAELQRSTLLELQDTLRELYGLASAVDLAVFGVMVENFRGVPSPEAKEAAEEEVRRAKDRFREAEAKVVLLISRVQDEPARRSATMFRIAANQVFRLDPNQQVEDLPRLLENPEISKVYQPYAKAIDLLGKLIRERY